VIAATAVLAVAALAAPTWPASPTAAAAAEPPAYLYVSNGLCGAAQDGTRARPFCTISAAAAVVVPGQTVFVRGGTYNEAVSITRSGTPTAPITFVADRGMLSSDMVRVMAGSGTEASAFAFSHVHDVTIKGFVAFGSPVGVLVDDSTDITVDGGAAHGAPGIRITGASKRVRVTRTAVQGSPSGRVVTALAVDAGVTDTVLDANAVVTNSGPTAVQRSGILVADAPRTTIVNNTLVTYCAGGVILAGASRDSVIENNIVETAANGTRTPTACPVPGLATGVIVSDASAPGTVADYNVIDPAGAAAPYTWARASYSSHATFVGATGQGAHDIVAGPRLGDRAGGDLFYFPLNGDSPAVDSADSDAPRMLPTDMVDNAYEDDPAVSNTGRGIGYADRGAAERVSAGVVFSSLARKPAAGPLDVVAAARWQPTHTTTGVVGVTRYEFSEDPWPVITKELLTDHSFRTAGERCVTVSSSVDGFRSASGSRTSTCVDVGAAYTPLTPSRVLDTRSAVGVTTTTPVPARGDVVLALPGVNGVAVADISAVVLNVTVTRPVENGSLTVSRSGTAPATSNVNFAPGQTVANLVTTRIDQGGIRFHNGSSGTVHVVADLEGYYGASGGGFASMTPTRVLDTRSGVGAPADTVAAGATVHLDLAATVPVGATAAVLNVTVTQASASGYLTVYPYGQPRPGASNLNFVAGRTRANLVAVPLAGRKVDLYNASGGTVHLVADLAGFYGNAASGATATFVPIEPVRITDTRTGLDVTINPPAPLPPRYAATTWATFGPRACQPTCPRTFVLNVTATRSTANGYLTVYPYSPASPNPPAASTLNFSADETVPNAAVVSSGTAGIGLYNASGGTVHVVVDEQGYFLPAGA
jgi:hypothetical protein